MLLGIGIGLDSPNELAYRQTVTNSGSDILVSATGRPGAE